MFQCRFLLVHYRNRFSGYQAPCIFGCSKLFLKYSFVIYNFLLLGLASNTELFPNGLRQIPSLWVGVHDTVETVAKQLKVPILHIEEFKEKVGAMKIINQHIAVMKYILYAKVYHHKNIHYSFIRAYTYRSGRAIFYDRGVVFGICLQVNCNKDTSCNLKQGVESVICYIGRKRESFPLIFLKNITTSVHLQTPEGWDKLPAKTK